MKSSRRLAPVEWEKCIAPETQHARELEKDNPEIWSGLGHAYALAGERAKAQKVLDGPTKIGPTIWPFI
jgi:hypothetical protein